MNYLSSLVLFCLLVNTFGKPSIQESESFFEKELFNNEINNRIIGGRPALEGTFPYQVSLQNYGRHFCGGSIINPQWILTAGHCISGAAPHQVTVVVGTNNLTRGGVEYAVKRLIRHPDYDWSEKIGDIGLIEINRAITYSSLVGSISLPSFDISKANTQVVTSGWGKTSAFGKVSTVLHYLNTKIVYHKLCRLFNSEVITDKNICTVSGFGKGVCSGDSGSPVVANGVQVGIVSWGRPYCALGVPDVHTRVYSYVNWINGYLNN